MIKGSRLKATKHVNLCVSQSDYIVLYNAHYCLVTLPARARDYDCHSYVVRTPTFLVPYYLLVNILLLL